MLYPATVHPDAVDDTSASAPSPVRFALVDLDLVDVEDNYRSQIDPVELRELAVSIRRIGVQKPVKLRPRPGGRYGVVDGERRLRASELEGADLTAHGPQPTDIPALIEELSDAKVREIQLVANSGHASVSPLDEGARFALMLERDGHTQESLGALVGKSPAWVRSRIDLLSAPTLARDAFRAGRLSLSNLQLVAREEDQAAAERMAERIMNGHVAGHDDEGEPLIEQLSHREAREVAARTAYEKRAAEATRAGIVVLDDATLATIFEPGKSVPVHDSPYVTLASDLPMDLADASGLHTWGDLAGEIPVSVSVLGRDGTGRAVELYDRAEIVRRATVAGDLTPPGEPDRKTKVAAMSTSEAKVERAKAAAKQALRQRIHRDTCAAVGDAASVPGKSNAKEMARWRWFASAVVRTVSAEGLHVVVTRLGLQLGGSVEPEAVALLDEIARTKDVDVLIGLMAEVLAADHGCRDGQPVSPNLESAVELFSVDAKGIASAVSALAKVEAKAAEAEKKASGKKGGGK